MTTRLRNDANSISRHYPSRRVKRKNIQTCFFSNHLEFDGVKPSSEAKGIPLPHAIHTERRIEVAEIFIHQRFHVANRRFLSVALFLVQAPPLTACM